jgi:hypothetical protein
MFKVSHMTLIVLSGLVWLGVGCMLLPLGINFVVESLLQEHAMLPRPVLNFIAPYVGGVDSAALVWIACMLLLGTIKGRRVFVKSVRRSVDRILSLPNPASISKIYSPGYYALLASMILLGILARFTSLDIRGGVDIAVGTALINGAMLYFREGWKARKEASSLS